MTVKPQRKKFHRCPEQGKHSEGLYVYRYRLEAIYQELYQAVGLISARQRVRSSAFLRSPGGGILDFESTMTSCDIRGSCAAIDKRYDNFIMSVDKFY